MGQVHYRSQEAREGWNRKFIIFFFCSLVQRLKLYREILCFQEKGNGKNKKWKLWRTTSVDSWKGFRGKHRSDSDGVDSSTVYSAAVATVLRAPPKDFKAVREEWAAIRIQTAFRGFLVSLLIGFD